MRLWKCNSPVVRSYEAMGGNSPEDDSNEAMGEVTVH